MFLRPVLEYFMTLKVFMPREVIQIKRFLVFLYHSSMTALRQRHVAKQSLTFVELDR